MTTNRKTAGVSLREIADECEVKPSVVRGVLRETPGLRASREVQDRIYATARRLGYDFKKLKLGKRMHARKETVEEILAKIEANPGWGRAEIVKHLRSLSGFVDRVHRRAFAEEFGGEDWL